jgi:hypothetical protein
MKKQIIISIAIGMTLLGSACTKKTSESPLNNGAVDVRPPENKQEKKEQTDAEKLKKDAAEKACNESWAEASATLDRFLEKPNAKDFKLFSQQQTGHPAFEVLCSNQEKIINTLDTKLEIFEKAAPSTFDYAVFLIRAQQYSDGAMAEGICEAGTAAFKKNPGDFLKALKQEKNREVPMDCFFDSPYEFVDMKPEEISAGYKKRLELLKSVKDRKVAAIRRKAIEIVQRQVKDTE